MRKKVIFIVGPTASGKSRAALRLAKKIGGEIISCDSMQVYKSMPILNQRPSIKERGGIRHHLLEVIEPTKTFNAADFAARALRAIREIHGRGRIPVFAGGTGLYMKALLDGIFEGPARDAAVRAKLERLNKRYGRGYLYRRLVRVDPEAASKIHPNDLRRLVRALEVYEVTKKPISRLQKTAQGIYNDYDVKIYGIAMERQRLYSRINRRVEEMFQKGAVAEVRKLLKRRLSITAKAALGIKEIKAYMDGELSLDEAKELLKKNTRRYAKRQLSWFRADKRVKWVQILWKKQF